MPPTEAQSVDRARAAFLAAAVGDALGWPMEDRGNRVGGTAKVRPAPRFVAWTRREGGPWGAHEQQIAAGTYSDDTQMLLAVARSRLRGPDWQRHLVEAELPLWLLYERGGGGALKRSARSWSMGRPPWDLGQKEGPIRKYFDAGGNGAAMRCLPHVLVDQAAGRFGDIASCLDADALATHGHPRALVGSRALAWGIRWALGRTSSLGYGELLDHVLNGVREWGQPPDVEISWVDSMERVAPRWYQDWDRSVGEMLDFLALGQRSLEQGAVSVDIETLERIGMFGKERGAGTVSAAAALFLATRYTSQPTQGLLASAFLRNTDSDTVAAMTGALLGALAGGDWLGELPRGLQDGPYLEEIAGSLAGGQAPEIDSFRWEPSVRTYLYRRLDKATPGESFDLPIFGNSTITEIEDYATRSQSFIRSWLLISEIGQSLTIKRIDKGKNGRPRWLGRYFRTYDRAAATPPELVEPLGRRRAGLVRLVSDLSIASRFYEEVVGLRQERATKSFVSFGWLALEESSGHEVEQLRLPSREDLEQSRQSIRVYIDEEMVARRHEEIEAAGLQVGAVRQKFGCSGFRCADPDGYVVEFRGYLPRIISSK